MIHSLDDNFKMEADDSTGTITLTARGKISLAMHKAIVDDTQATEYLALVSDMLSNLRKDQQRPQAEEYVAIQFAYHLLGRGHIMPHCYQWLGLPGTRKYTQTYRKCLYYIAIATCEIIIYMQLHVDGTQPAQQASKLCVCVCVFFFFLFVCLFFCLFVFPSDGENDQKEGIGKV